MAHHRFNNPLWLDFTLKNIEAIVIKFTHE